MGFLFGGGKKDSSSQIQPVSSPKVTDESSATKTEDKEKLRRLGRLSLIQSSPKGVLGNPTTGRRKLLADQA